ncbi:MAG: STAS domain-containing protein [Planctomycetota bacterium]|jgi:anti-sigma B factor antagonist
MEQISVQDRDGARWMILSGEWDQTDVLHLKPEYDGAVDSAPGDVVVDLGGVTFIGTLGIGLLLTTRKKLFKKEAALKLANIPPTVMKSLQAMSLDEVFEIAE